MRLRPRIFFDEKKQLDDELPNDVLSASNEKLMGKDPSKSSPRSKSITIVLSTPNKLERISGDIITNGKIKQEVDMATANCKSRKQSCSDHSERKVSKRERQKSCTSTAKAREKKRHKEEERLRQFQRNKKSHSCCRGIFATVLGRVSRVNQSCRNPLLILLHLS
uniref:Uncharacterized protein n=1 Tax=Ditylenchus dipsaci TaxID=166011 RepID=A0A915D3G8_9BILA